MKQAVLRQMRADWNERARADAYYYVAFQRRHQDDGEFFQTASGVVDWIRDEMRRLECAPHACRMLEIGCGPGRLMLPLAKHCGEIHGVDVSDEMIRLARRNLAHVPNAHPQVTSGADLSMFPEETFDFVYSYAVFQHIPSKDVVFKYLRESFRVLKRNGILTCQMNSLREDRAGGTTWDGTSIDADDLLRFVRELDCQLLTLDGAGSRYMWVTWRKRRAGWRAGLGSPEGIAISAVRSENGTAPRIHAGAPSTLLVTLAGFAGDCDLAEVAGRLGGLAATPRALIRAEPNGQVDLSFAVPSIAQPGRVYLEVFWQGARIGEPSAIDVLPASEREPKLIAAADGVNYLSGSRIASRYVKAVVENWDAQSPFQATIDGVGAKRLPAVLIDPARGRFELNIRVPEFFSPGRHRLTLRSGRYSLPAVPVQIGMLQVPSVLAHLPPGATVLEFENWASGGGRRVPCTVIRFDDATRHHTAASVEADPLHLPFAAGALDGAVYRWDPAHGPWDQIAAQLGRALKPASALYVEVAWFGESSREQFIDATERSTALKCRGSRPLGRYRPPRFRRGPARWVELGERAVMSLARRACDRFVGTRLARDGAGIYFGPLWKTPERQARLNVCVCCGTAHSSGQIKAACPIVWRCFLAFYRCPACGVPNVLTSDL